MAKKRDYIILMADIIDSRKSDQRALMSSFKKVTKEINTGNKQLLLSPMTITLGDEFQGVVTDVRAALELVFFIEEKIIHSHSGFKLRFVIMEGEIETPINKEIAYGMLGDGLTRARQALQEAKSAGRRYHLELKDQEAGAALGHSLLIYQRIIDGWKLSKDHALLSGFIRYRDYKRVADELGKSRSQIWKREKSLRIEEYFSIKEVIEYIGGRK